ncbi:APC family permease [Leucobacter sp. GX24907]
MSHSPEREIAAEHRGSDSLQANALGVPSIVFFIIAAASPLTGVVGLVPIMIGLGNGAGAPVGFLFAAGILLLFAVGYLAMSRHVLNAGALYSYITIGLGRFVGLGSATLTIFAYSCIQFSLYGGFGYYVNSLVLAWTGVDIPWWTFALGAMLGALALGIRGVHAGGLVLGVLIVLECSMLALLGAGIIVNPGGTGTTEFSLEPFSIPAIFATGLGVAIMFAHTTFIGFEGSAIYAEEAKNPLRTIPRATYTAVIVMAIIYAGTSYLVISALGPRNAQEVALRESGDLLFFVSAQALGPWASHLFQVLIITAIFAAAVTFHNNISRYLYVLGRQGLISAKLGKTLSTRKTPYIASIAQTASAVVVILGFAVAGLDPYTTLFVWLAGIGTVAIISAQTIAAVAIFVFFRRTGVDRRVWHTMVAPILAIIGLVVLLSMSLGSLELILGTSGGLTALLVGLYVASLVIGVLYAVYLKHFKPGIFEKMRVMLTSDGSTTTIAVVDDPLIRSELAG